MHSGRSLDCFAGKNAAELADAAPCKATVMAQRALKLLYSLASYFASHGALQADGCLDVIVAAMASSDVTCAQYAVWAIQSLTGRVALKVLYKQNHRDCPFCAISFGCVDRRGVGLP